MPKSDRGEVDIIRSRRALEALGSEWDMLASTRELPMLTHAWVLSCAEALYGEDELCVITVREHGVLTGVAPLVARRSAGLTHLEVIGSSFLGEPSDLLYRTDESLAMLVRAIRGVGRPVVLARIPSQSPVIARFRYDRGLVLVTQVTGTVGLPISLEWNAYLTRQPSRLRYDLKRAQRRAEEVGTRTVRTYSPRPDEVEDMFAELVRVEATGWKARNGSSLSQRQHMRQFFLRYATLAATSGVLRFSFLDVNAKAVAAQLSVEYADRLWVLKIGYDEAWSRVSPGWQLMAETVRYAFERKLKSFEFLGSDEAWLHRWDTEDRELSTLAAYPATIPGMYGLATDTAARVRDKVRSLIHDAIVARSDARRDSTHHSASTESES
jgi:CelD/BcsL family acetyltransferase involved in cellulose biosynthesis